MNSSDFKSALGSWASGVAVISTEEAGLCQGVTVSSFTSLSLDPPLILICLVPTARVVAPLRRTSRFAVSVLAADQEGVSRHFAARGRAPQAGFGAIPVSRTPDGLPTVAGAAAWLECTAEALLPQGDHLIVVGRVESAGADDAKSPLLYFRRDYQALAGRGRP